MTINGFHFIGCCVLIMFRLCAAGVVAQQKSYEESRQELELFDRMTSNYDPRIRPPTTVGTPVVVKIDLFLRNLGSVDDVRMEFTADILIRQTWNDTRLGFFGSRIKGDFISLTSALAERIWKPDLFFSLERQSRYHELLTPNRMLRLYPGGKILYSARITSTSHCHMKLWNYPFDVQKCNFTLGSFSYTDRDVRYEWRDRNAFNMREGIEGTQFMLTDMKPITCVNSHYTGNFSCLTVQFLFERQYGYHLVQTFIPTTLLVIVSWASFFLDVDATPARVTLGVTTLLTVSTQTTGIRSSLPPVSYTKAIDVWMAVCTALIFLALLEFAMVNLISRKASERRRLPRTHTAAAFAALGRYLFGEEKQYRKTAATDAHELSRREQSSITNDAGEPAVRRRPNTITGEDDNGNGKTVFMSQNDGSASSTTVRSPVTPLTLDSAIAEDNPFATEKSGNTPLEQKSLLKRSESVASVNTIDYKARAKLIDVACRVIFPLLFAAFNCVYWTTYFLILQR